jgi:hypothetical protein
VSGDVERSVARARWLILLGWIAPPLVWLGELQAAYALVAPACRMQRTWPLWAVTGVGLAVVAATGTFTWRHWRPPSLPDDDPGARDRFLAVVGVFLCVEVALVLVAQALALAILHPCD